MLKNCRICLFLLAFLIVLASCDAKGNSETRDQDSSDEKNERVAIDEEKRIIESNNTLGFRLLDQVESEHGNIFISPLSAMTAILLVYNGAEGETKQEIAEALQVNDMTVEEVNEAVSQLTNLFHEDKDVELHVANSVWLHDLFHFDDEYTKAMEAYYSAKLETIDIEDDASVDRMNDWVSEATNDKVKDMVEKPLKENFVAMILNAIYFNGKWQNEFEADTTEATFYTEEKEITVPFMTLEAELSYAETDLFQAVELPYGSGEMNMQIFLPKENVGIHELKKQLTEKNWTNWNREFHVTNGVITLPKFQLEYETNLNTAFQQLGMELAFDERNAEFPHIMKEDEQIFIDEIKQKTFMSVTEEGTEAAGATSVEIALTSAIVEEENFHLEVNRPFFMTITERETNTILFLGEIHHPKQIRE